MIGERHKLLVSKSIRATEEEVLAVEAPPFTESWHPFPHKDVVHAIGTVVQEQGLEVIHKDYSLSKDNQRLFAVWSLAGDEFGPGVHKAMGFRTSTNKSLSVGLCAGSRTTVCDNLIFTSDVFVDFRRHTGALSMEGLLYLAESAMTALKRHFTEYVGWTNDLRNKVLSPTDFKAMTYDAALADAIPLTRMRDFDALVKSVPRYNDGTAYGWMGAATELIRDRSLFQISERSDKVRRFLTDNLSLAAAASGN